MHQHAGKDSSATLQSTRRHLLKAGVAVGLGIGAAALPGGRPLRPAAAAGVQGGHLNILNVGYPEVWDPHLAGTVLALAAISPLYNQVVEFDPLNPKEVIGDLARSWEVTDGGLSFVFHLHDNVKWTDGKDVTAEDVVFSLNRMVEPGKPRPRVGLLRPYIKAVEAMHRHTVKVTLNYPSPAFLQFLAVDYMKILPKHVVEAGVDINVWENIVSSGPFKIKSARRGDSVTYERNPTYFKKGRPFVDGFTLLAIADAGTAAAAVKAGRIHMTTGVTALGVDDLLRLAQELKGQICSLLAAHRDGCVAYLWQCRARAMEGFAPDQGPPPGDRPVRITKRHWRGVLGNRRAVPAGVVVWQHQRRPAPFARLSPPQRARYRRR